MLKTMFYLPQLLRRSFKGTNSAQCQLNSMAGVGDPHGAGLVTPWLVLFMIWCFEV